MTELIPAPFWQQLVKYPLITVELELCFIILLLFVKFGGQTRWLRPFHLWFRKTARRQGRAVLWITAIAIVAHLCALPVLRTPVPGIHDEFSYLLAADTFASGRLANPTHPLWIYFESFHIDQFPTYASMYPPAPGFAMALGILLGSPIVGVWLSTAALCAAICWMLQAWVPPKWAFAGGLLAVARIGVFSYWANTYWGGSVAALGGCLLWGAFGRFRRTAEIRHAVWMGIGLIILGTSRPYEGFWVSLPVAAAMGWWALTRRHPVQGMFWRGLVALSIVLGVGAAAMGYYNWRVFGSPLTMPYTVNRKVYSIAPTFPWEQFGPVPNYNHRVMRDFYTTYETGGFQSERTWQNFLRLERVKAFTVWVFFLGPALTAPLIVFLIGAFRKRTDLLWPAAGLGMLLLGLAIVSWPTNPHYYSPATGCLYAVLMEGLRRIYVWRRNRGFPGKPVALACMTACVAVLAVRVSGQPLNVPQVNNTTPVPWHAAETFPLINRQRVINALRRRGGKHLVIVRYSPSHLPHQEYVYNDANIDTADIVWAREFENPLRNLPLVNYFRDRSIWLFQPDLSPVITPYPITPQPVQ